VSDVTGETAQRFYDALHEYNRGDYLSAQEGLERVHAECEAADQGLVKGLLMLACGLHLHFNRGGGRGTLNLLRQSLIAFDDYRPTHLGVEVGELYDALDAYLQELQERTKPGARFLDRWLAPRIRYQTP
jgi:hypothetical protein